MTIDKLVLIEIGLQHPQINRAFNNYALNKTKPNEDKLKEILNYMKNYYKPKIYIYYNHIYNGIRGIQNDL